MRSLLLVLSAIFLLSVIDTKALIPEGGEQWVAGKSYNIIWEMEDFGGGAVDISLWDGTSGEWYPVASSVPVAIGEFKWIIPRNLHGNYFRIKIQSKEKPGNYRMSQSFFFIMTADGNEGGGHVPAISVGSIRLTPNPADETVIISWQYDAKQLIIRDLLGRKVREYFMDPSTYSMGVSVIGWLEGLYMVELRLLNGHTVYERLLVMP